MTATATVVGCPGTTRPTKNVTWRLPESSGTVAPASTARLSNWTTAFSDALTWSERSPFACTIAESSVQIVARKRPSPVGAVVMCTGGRGEHGSGLTMGVDVAVRLSVGVTVGLTVAIAVVVVLGVTGTVAVGVAVTVGAGATSKAALVASAIAPPEARST